MAFSQGLLQGRLNWSLSKRGTSTYREITEIAEKYAMAEDISHIKMEDYIPTTSRSSGQSRKGLRSNTDKGKEHQTIRQVNTGLSTTSARAPPRGLFDRYTPLKFSLERIFDIAKKDGLF